MRSIAILLMFMALTYLLVYTLNERAYKEYQRGYNDAITTQGAIDKACIAWWYQVNVKQVKEKICGKKR